MSESTRAIFLSYASQDAEAARQICESLRQSGVEVWFDADGGLEHGDEWDAKIRRQIKECVLFIPVISANTQAREEGYFRLEWDLAAERARTIASGVPFILPVVIDDTREPDALVPDRFRMVQWTKLPGGVVTPEVKARYLKLWSHRTGAAKHQREPKEPGSGQSGEGAPTARVATRRWLIPAIVGVIAFAGMMVWRPWRTSPSEPTARGVAQPAATGVASEADQFVRRSRTIIYDPDSGRTEFALAESFLKRAIDLTPDAGAAWGASALLQHYFYSRAYDQNTSRLVRSQAEAEKALRLDPHNTDALLALGLHRQVLNEHERAQEYLERARAADPQNFKAILALSLQMQDRRARAHFLLDAAGKVLRPAELYYYAALDFIHDRQFAKAARACDQAILAQPFWRTFVMRANIEKLQTADPAKITAWLDRVPELKRDEPRVALLRYQAAMLRRDHATALRVLNGVAVEYFEDNFFSGPKSFLLAPAHELAGQEERAIEQWQIAERSIREKQSSNPTAINWRAMLTVALAGQKRGPDAQAAVDRCTADERLVVDFLAMEHVADALLRLGHPGRAADWLRKTIGRAGWPFVSAATLAIDPRWELLRARPEYGPLRAAFAQAESDTPIASDANAAKAPEKSVAVLPFVDQSADKDNESFSEGISEELGVVLNQVPGLGVAGWNSSLAFKGKNVPDAEIAQKLGVTHIVSGSVLKSGTQVRITARLVNAADGFSLWSESFRREAKDILAVQDEIAGLIAQKLQLQLGVEARRTRTVNPEAYRLVLEGRHFWNQRNQAGFTRAESSLLRAIENDPSFAEAHAALAGVYIVRADYQELPTNAPSVVEDIRKARRAAERAVELGSNLAEANAALAYIQMVQGESTAAGASFGRALAINPQSPTTNLWHAVWHLTTGRIDSALESFRRVESIDPLWFINLHLYGETLFYAGRQAEALEICDRAASLRPDVFIPNLGLRAKILFALNRPDEALQVARSVRQKKLADTRWNADGDAIRIIRLCGYAAEARDFAAEVLQRLEKQSPVRPHVFAAAGDFESAVAAVGDVRTTQRRYYFWEPAWDPWREDPRFERALATLGCAAEYKVARESQTRLQAERAKKQ